MRDLSDTCLIVNALVSAEEPLTVVELNKITELPKEAISSILPRLIQQDRAKKHKEGGRGKYRYSYNEAGQFRSTRGNQPGRRAVKKPLWMRVERGEEKVALLKKVLKIANDKAGLVESILRDYGVTKCSE